MLASSASWPVSKGCQVVAKPCSLTVCVIIKTLPCDLETTTVVWCTIRVRRLHRLELGRFHRSLGHSQIREGRQIKCIIAIELERIVRQSGAALPRWSQRS